MSEPASALLLVVNDDPPSRYLLARYLRQGGFRVLEAKDGAEALEMVAREPPNLIVLDVRLPHVSGYEVGRRLRADPMTSNIGILYISAYYTVDVASAEAGEGDAYMAQPVDQSELLTTVQLVLKTRRGG